MPEQTIAVVVGLPALASVLSNREVFEAVVDAPAGAGLQKALAGAPVLRNAHPSAVLFLLSGEHEGADALAARLERIGHKTVLLAPGEPGSSSGSMLSFPADALVNDALVALTRAADLPYLLPEDDGEEPLFGASAAPADEAEGGTAYSRGNPILVDPFEAGEDTPSTVVAGDPGSGQAQSSDAGTASVMAAIPVAAEGVGAAPQATEPALPPPPSAFAPPRRGGRRRPAPAAEPSPAVAAPAEGPQVTGEETAPTDPGPPDWLAEVVSPPPVPSTVPDSQEPPETGVVPAARPGPDLAPPSWATEEPPVTQPEPERSAPAVQRPNDEEGPPAWLSDVVAATEPGARAAVAAQRAPVQVEEDPLREAVATDERWDDRGLPALPGLDELPAVDGFDGAPDPVWDVVMAAGDRPPPRRLPPNAKVKVIAFTVPKGGTGKTASSVYGAVLLADAGKRVLYIDNNAMQADGSETFDMASTSPTIVDLTFDNEPITRESVWRVLTQIPTPTPDRLFALFGPHDPRQADPLVVTPDLYTQALDAVADEFDYVIIDAPIAESYRDMISDFIIPRADYIVNVVTPNWTTVTNTYQWLLATTDPGYAASRAYPMEQVGWFFNRYESDIDFDEESAVETLRPWRFLGQIPDFKSVRRAANRGEVPHDPQYVSALATVFHEITHEECLRPAMGQGGKRRRFPRRGN